MTDAMPRRSPASPPDARPQRRKRRPSADVRALLLDAARAEFERAGYAGATTAAIAERASATEAQLFRTFRSKSELFRAAVLDPLNRAFEAFNATHLEAPSAEADWDELTRRYISDLSVFIMEHRHPLMSLIVAQAYGGANVEGVGKVGGLKEYFGLGATMMCAQGGDARVDPALMVRVSFGAVLAAVMFREWLFADVDAADDAIASALADFVREGIRVNHPLDREAAQHQPRPHAGRPPRPSVRTIA
jgi:AcrR family transcriptional regulator